MRCQSAPISKKAQFVEASVQAIDLERRVVHARTGDDTVELPYDQLVIALGGMTNQRMIPGSEHAFTFKTLVDAMLLRNHIIERSSAPMPSVTPNANAGSSRL